MGQDSTEVKIDDLLYHVTSIVQKQKKEVRTLHDQTQKNEMIFDSNFYHTKNVHYCFFTAYILLLKNVTADCFSLGLIFSFHIFIYI